MRPVAAIVVNTLREVMGLRRLAFFGLGALVPAFILFISSANPTGEELVDAFLGLGIFMHFMLAVPVTTLILSAAALGEERRSETLSFLVVRPIRRSTIAATKLGAALVTALTFNVVGAAAMGIVFGARGGDWSYVGPMLLGSVLATAFYSAVFVPLGFLSERSTIIGLVYVFIWETAIAGNLSALATTSAWRLGYAAYVALAPADMLDFLEDGEGFVLGNMTASAPTAVIQALVIMAASTALLTWILRRRDLV